MPLMNNASTCTRWPRPLALMVVMTSSFAARTRRRAYDSHVPPYHPHARQQCAALSRLSNTIRKWSERETFRRARVRTEVARLPCAYLHWRTAIDRLLSLGRRPPTTAMQGGFNRSAQHTNHCSGRRSVASEVPDSEVLHRQSEGTDVGALEGRVDSSPDRPAV